MDGRDYELIAQQVSGLSQKMAAIEERLAEVEKVNTRLEAAYEAMRREEERQDVQEDLSQALPSDGLDFQAREGE